MGLKVVAQTEHLSKILVVDDDISHHNILGLALRKEFEVCFESSGANAVETALREKPELILLDLNMPHVDGYEVLDQFKKNPALIGIPIFCMSAHTDEATREHSTRLGASAFISKPITVKTLSHDIKQILSNLSVSLTSKDLRTSVYIGINENDMKNWFQGKVENIPMDKKILVLSVREGAFFQNETLESYLESGRMVYLQIKPSLMSRLPFLDNFSMVMTDLLDLLGEDPANYHVVMDRPELLLLSPSIENKTAVILGFGEMLRGAFSEVCYNCRRPGTMFEQTGINEMARLLARKF